MQRALDGKPDPEAHPCPGPGGEPCGLGAALLLLARRRSRSPAAASARSTARWRRRAAARTIPRGARDGRARRPHPRAQRPAAAPRPAAAGFEGSGPGAPGALRLLTAGARVDSRCWASRATAPSPGAHTSPRRTGTWRRSPCRRRHGAQRHPHRAFDCLQRARPQFFAADTSRDAMERRLLDQWPRTCTGRRRWRCGATRDRRCPADGAGGAPRAG